MSLAARARALYESSKTPEGKVELERRLKALDVVPPAEPVMPEAREVAHHVARMGVPSMLINAALSPRDTPAMMAAREWWAGDKSEHPALVMAGDVGLGKSTAAAWCVLEWARGWAWNKQPTGAHAEPCLWWDAATLADLGAWDDNVRETLANARTARLVVLDDAGWDGDRRAVEAVAGVLMARVNHCRQVVLTSNLKGEAFRQRYGVALADRLRVLSVIPKLTGSSLRGGA